MPNNQPQLLTLLIGIDRYSQIPLPDGSYYPHLGGCVRDINQVETMLKSRLHLPDSQIFKLTSSRGQNDSQVESAGKLPTYKNLVKAFKDITAKASAGDRLYIHYSGHGGRSTTMFPTLKGKNGLDESIVPCDIGENGVCYLRDVEMAYLLKAMSDKGLLVTLVLDSCHSGGATRAAYEGIDSDLSRCVPRGIGRIDRRKPPKSSDVAGQKELLEAFQMLPVEARRNAVSGGGWSLPTPENCVFIAACRADELANEYPFNGYENNGVLTYWMIDSLNQIGEGYTYKMLYNRIVAKVHSKFARQTPQIEGDRDREIFGSLRLKKTATVNVLEVDAAQKRIRLNTGLAQGIGRGAQFAVFAADANDFSKPENSLAIVEIEEPEAAESWANIVSGDRSGEIAEGSQAVLLGIGIRLRGRVRLVRSSADSNTVLDNLEKFIKQQDGNTEAQDKWIRLAEDNEEADFQVAVNRFGEFEIRDTAGVVLPNLHPALKIADAAAIAKLTRRLTHLTKYRNVRLIDNTDPRSPLANKLTAELGIFKDNADGTKTFTALGIPLRPLSIGEQFCLRVKNNSDKPLNIALIDLAPDWSISQVYLDGVVQDYELLENGADDFLDYRLEAYLPDKYQEGTDTLKVFATVDPTDFGWLNLPSLDETADLRDGVLPKNPLERLMTSFTEKNVRNVKPVINLAAAEGQAWATASVEARVRRESIAHIADPALSLLQSAFDEVIANKKGATKTRSLGGREENILRPDLSNPDINLITQYALAESRSQLNNSAIFDQKILEDKVDKQVVVTAMRNARERGAVDTAKYCAGLAVGMAKNLFDAKVNGNTTLYEEYKAAFTKKMGDCDPNYAEAAKQFLSFLASGGAIEYRNYADIGDFVIDGNLPDQAVVGIVADWGTGQTEALEVLRQVKNYQPQVAIHLGDIYYSGTEYEVENYFLKPWTEILGLPDSNILSLVLPGNHDVYGGGAPFYKLLDKLQALNGLAEQSASYFCLRNKYWQLIGLDTAYKCLGGSPTRLEDQEVEWLKDKFATADGRKTILFSHHQLFSANDNFDGETFNPNLYSQLEAIIPQTDLWLWGHEHDLVIFDEYKNLKRGRCIGGSAFPVGNFEMPTAAKNAEVPFNHEVELSKGEAFYQHCYTILKLCNEHASVLYCEDGDGGRVLFEEKL